MQGDWKLILPSVREKGAKTELYQISKDVSENTDLAEKESERVKELTKLLDAWWQPTAP